MPSAIFFAQGTGDFTPYRKNLHKCLESAIAKLLI